MVAQTACPPDFFFASAPRETTARSISTTWFYSQSAPRPKVARFMPTTSFRSLSAPRETVARSIPTACFLWPCVRETVVRCSLTATFCRVRNDAGASSQGSPAAKVLEIQGAKVPKSKAPRAKLPKLHSLINSSI